MDGYQIMHNGLKIEVDSYYGSVGTEMLKANLGCHEPQEEALFDRIIKSLPSGSTMIEVGAYWGFYSLWFCHSIQNAKVFLVEPEAANLAAGQRNFALNNQQGDFTKAYVDATPGIAADRVGVVSIESLFKAKHLDHVNLLHADIQGFEYRMLAGAKSLLEERRIDYLFISTHSMELHQQCSDFLREHGYLIAASVDLEETYSFDGILLGHSPLIVPPQLTPPSKKFTVLSTNARPKNP